MIFFSFDLLFFVLVQCQKLRHSARSKFLSLFFDDFLCYFLNERFFVYFPRILLTVANSVFVEAFVTLFFSTLFFSQLTSCLVSLFLRLFSSFTFIQHLMSHNTNENRKFFMPALIIWFFVTDFSVPASLLASHSILCCTLLYTYQLYLSSTASFLYFWDDYFFLIWCS